MTLPKIPTPLAGLQTSLANVILDHLTGHKLWVMPTGLTAQLHIGDPGPDQTNNLSAVLDKQIILFEDALGGMIDVAAPAPVWMMSAIEVLTHISIWDNIGTPLWSTLLDFPQPVVPNDSYTLEQCILSFNNLTLVSMSVMLGRVNA